MVKTLTIAALLLSLKAWAIRSEFRVEYGKPEIYIGEPVMVQYVVYTDQDVVEVEVAKFPEYKGYWKENLTLRQGPIVASPGMDARMNSAIVGSYLIVPMLSQKENELEPMKIALSYPSQRRIEGSAPPQFTFSEGPKLKVKPLPPLPSNLKHVTNYSGAVGRLQLTIGESTVSFLPNEPFQIRYLLQGHGNFQDLNDLSIKFPEGLEILSKRTYTQGGIQFTSKTFEYTASLKVAQSMTLSSFDFVYFDPERARYQTITVPPILLTPSITSQAREDISEGSQLLNEMSPTWSNYHEWVHDRGFLWSQAGLALVLSALLGFQAFRTGPRAKREKKKPLKEIVAQAYKEKTPEEFLAYADDLTFQALCMRLNRSPYHTTKSQLLRLAQGKLDPKMLEYAQAIFDAHEQVFSPGKKTSLQPESLYTLLQHIL